MISKSLYLELKSFLKSNNIYIYQMGKVGSSFLERSLENAIHIHNFYPNNRPCSYYDIYLKKLRGRLYWSKYKAVMYIKRYGARKGKNLFIVPIRDPFSRSKSMFFQNLHMYFVASHNYTNLDNKFVVNDRASNKDLLSDLFNSRFEFDYFDRWFREDFEKLFDISILEYKFDTSKGWLEISNNERNIFLYRVDLLEHDSLKNVLSLRYNLDLKSLDLDSNSAVDKWYSSIYKNDLKISDANLDKIMESDYVNMFFNKSELNKFANKLRGGV
ncbi:hypothetical protein E0X81_12025 [Halomonas sp. GDM18]|nr:hypothetical protein E0X81_12025 [Halomonas sp. GDM18]